MKAGSQGLCRPCRMGKQHGARPVICSWSCCSARPRQLVFPDPCMSCGACVSTWKHQITFEMSICPVNFAVLPIMRLSAWHAGRGSGRAAAGAGDAAEGVQGVQQAQAARRVPPQQGKDGRAGGQVQDLQGRARRQPPRGAPRGACAPGVCRTLHPACKAARNAACRAARAKGL